MNNPPGSVIVQLPAISLTEWRKQEPNRFAGYIEHCEAGFLRERGDDARFEFMLADSPPSADWFRPSAREAAWFFAHDHGRILGVLEDEFLIQTSSSVLVMSHFYIREDSVLLKVTKGKFSFMCMPVATTSVTTGYSLWRRRLRAV